jgi:hypothetical protein
MRENSTTISTQLIQAALTMITVMSAVTVYIMENRIVHLGYYIVLFTSFFCFVLSIFFGGKGLTQLEKKRTKCNWFNLQAITSFIGIFMFCFSVFMGKSKLDTVEVKLMNIEKDYKRILELFEVKNSDNYTCRENKR